MSQSNATEWTPNDYSNIITIGAAAIGTTLLVIFKSRCKTISLCWGLIGCNRDVVRDDEGDAPDQPVALPRPGDPVIPPVVPQNNP